MTPVLSTTVATITGCFSLGTMTVMSLAVTDMRSERNENVVNVIPVNRSVLGGEYKEGSVTAL